MLITSVRYVFLMTKNTSVSPTWNGLRPIRKVNHGTKFKLFLKTNGISFFFFIFSHNDKIVNQNVLSVSLNKNKYLL